MSSDAVLTRTLQNLLDRHRVPGAALSVLRDGQPVYRACLGTMSNTTRAPLAKHHSFDIGSISKTFNAACLALLVDEGRLSFDDRAVDLLPGFRLSDPSLSEHVTLRDLLGQSVGFGEDSITNYASHFSRAELVAQVRHLPLHARFREECAYQQHGPLVATAILERAAGMAWEDFVEQRLVAPLGLRETWATYSRLPDKAVACDPHMDLGDADSGGGAMTAIGHRNFDNLAPTGAMVSSQRDMEVWWDMFARGGAGLLRPETVGEMLTPRVPVRRHGIHPQRWTGRFLANFVSYGIGMFLHDFAGRLVAEHTGALEGFYVVGCAVPAEKLAAVVLTNQHGCAALPALRYHLLAHGLGLPQEDFDAQYRAIAPRPKVLMRDGEPYYWRPLEQRRGTVPSWPLGDLVGDYCHPGFGIVPVRLGSAGLDIDVVGTPCRAEHWHQDVFHAVPHEPAMRVVRPDLFVRFRPDAAGRPMRLVLPGMLGDFVRGA